MDDKRARKKHYNIPPGTWKVIFYKDNKVLEVVSNILDLEVKSDRIIAHLSNGLDKTIRGATGFDAEKE